MLKTIQHIIKSSNLHETYTTRLRVIRPIDRILAQLEKLENIGITNVQVAKIYEVYVWYYMFIVN